MNSRDPFFKFDRLSIPGYNLQSNPRLHKKGGGTAILIKNGFIYNTNTKVTDIESTNILMELKQGSPINICSVYIPPNKDIVIEALEKLYNNRKFILLGDLNAKSTLWGSKQTDRRGNIIEKFLSNNNLVCLNNGQGTRLNRSGTLSHLDITFVSPSLANVASWSVWDDNLGSDHYPIILELNQEPMIEFVQKDRWNIKKANWLIYKSFLQNNKMDSKFDSQSLDLKNDMMSNRIINAAKESIPLKSKTIHPNAVPYWTDECKNIIQAKHMAEKKMRKTKLISDCKEYFRIKGEVQFVLKKAKREYWEKYCSTLSKDSKTGDVWKTIKMISGIKQKSNQSGLKDGNKTFTTNIEKADALAAEFDFNISNKNRDFEFINNQKSTVNSYLNDLSASRCIIDGSSNLNKKLTIEELQSALREINTDSSPGQDKITFHMLQNLPEVDKLNLLEIFNESWSSGVLPSSWKHSIINPILKSNKDPSQIKSYRPIAITSTICKLMEKIIANRLMWYLENNNLLNINQSGFRTNHSTMDQIVRLQTDISRSFKDNEMTVAIFLDFEKAFDMVWTDGILLKLCKLNVSGNMYYWIKNFLSNRSAQVNIGDACSKSFFPDNGTPQGSILSPLLFLILINDFPQLSQNTNTSLFADDSSLWRSGSNLRQIVHHLQIDLCQIEKWCVKWGFKLNETKSIGMVFLQKQ